MEFLQKRSLNIIFRDGEHAANLIIVNVQTPSRESRRQQLSVSHSFSSDGHALGGGAWPLVPLDLPLFLWGHFLFTCSDNFAGSLVQTIWDTPFRLEKTAVA